MRLLNSIPLATTALLGGIFGIVTGCVSQHPTESWHSGGWVSPSDDDTPGLIERVSLEPPPEINSFVKDVREAAADTGNPQESLRCCTRLVWTRCVDRSWDRVRGAMERDGAVFVERPRFRETPWHTYRWVGDPNAFTAPSGTHYQLDVEFSIAGQMHYEEQGNAMIPKYDGPLVVHRATASLRGKPGRSTADLVSGGEFARLPAVRTCLGDDKLKDVIPPDWPLDELSVAYEPFQWISPFGTNMGFTVHLRGHDTKGAGARRGGAFRVISHLDPTPLFNVPRTWLKRPPGFVPASALGPVESIGSFSESPTDPVTPRADPALSTHPDQ
jgi:hypothetical protein